MAEDYRSALRSLSASGESWAGRTALLDFESRILADLGDVSQLQNVQRSVAEQLAKHDPETLVPLIEVHSALYRTYRERRRFALLTHARLQAEWLAELYASTVKSQGSHVVAARALASLAGYLQEAVLPSASRRLYEQALVHEPGNEAALLGLAISFERYGDYLQAVKVLRRLTDTRPSMAEGRLRLAINLGRIGEGRAAVEHLRQLVQPAVPRWVRSLAYEELARQLVAAGHDAEAIELLSTASSELGDPAGILVLLAHLLDLQDQPHQATGVLSRLVSVRTGESPRRRYDGWPESALAEVRSQLEETAASRIPLLRQSLEVAG
jgi:tetratricopeptide (TPR) repeat protein